jgi:hypothetical protein
MWWVTFISHGAVVLNLSAMLAAQNATQGGGTYSDGTTIVVLLGRPDPLLRPPQIPPFNSWSFTPSIGAWSFQDLTALARFCVSTVRIFHAIEH